MPCLSSNADSVLNDSIRVSNAESQLALPLMITTFLGVSVISSPKGSAVWTGAGQGGKNYLDSIGTWLDTDGDGTYDTLEVETTLHPYQVDEHVLRLKVKLPDSLAPGPLRIVVSDGATVVLPVCSCIVASPWSR